MHRIRTTKPAAALVLVAALVAAACGGNTTYGGRFATRAGCLESYPDLYGPQTARSLAAACDASVEDAERALARRARENAVPPAAPTTTVPTVPPAARAQQAQALQAELQGLLGALPVDLTGTASPSGSNVAAVAGAWERGADQIEGRVGELAASPAREAGARMVAAIRTVARCIGRIDPSFETASVRDRCAPDVQAFLTSINAFGSALADYGRG